MLGGVSPHFCTLIFCFVQIYVFQNLTFSFSYYSKMCCNILREHDSEIISPLFKKKPIQLKDLFWWKKYVIYFFLVETMKFSSLILRHTLNWVGAQGVGTIFEKFQGGCLIFEFYCIFMRQFQKISKFQWLSGGTRLQHQSSGVGAGGLSPPHLTYVLRSIYSVINVR